MVDLSSLSPITTAATALSNLILVTPNQNTGYQPQTSNGAASPQAPSLLFHYEGEQTISLESDITDHFVEDNTAIQDQVSLKPVLITTHGYIGELNDITPKALSPLRTAADKLTVVSAYTPALSATALLAYNNAFQLYQIAQNTINSAVSAWSSITGSSQSQNKQQEMFTQFWGYWQTRTLFTVQTPWAKFSNMAIKSLRAIQDDTTRVITDFEVTFKMMRFSNTATTGGAGPVLQSRAASQASGLVDLGTYTPSPSIGLGTGLTQMGA